MSDYLIKENMEEYEIKIVDNKILDGHEMFVITDSNNNERIIDDSCLQSTPFFKSMEKFTYYPIRADISNGHVLLTYIIAPGLGWGYDYLVLEYDFKTNTLQYKALVILYEVNYLEYI